MFWELFGLFSIVVSTNVELMLIPVSGILQVVHRKQTDWRFPISGRNFNFFGLFFWTLFIPGSLNCNLGIERDSDRERETERGGMGNVGECRYPEITNLLVSGDTGPKASGRNRYWPQRTENLHIEDWVSSSHANCDWTWWGETWYKMRARGDGAPQENGNKKGARGDGAGKGPRAAILYAIAAYPMQLTTIIIIFSKGLPCM